MHWFSPSMSNFSCSSIYTFSFILYSLRFSLIFPNYISPTSCSYFLELLLSIPPKLVLNGFSYGKYRKYTNKITEQDMWLMCRCNILIFFYDLSCDEGRTPKCTSHNYYSVIFIFIYTCFCLVFLLKSLSTITISFSVKSITGCPSTFLSLNMYLHNISVPFTNDVNQWLKMVVIKVNGIGYLSSHLLRNIK